jgi:hypothetical protein
MFETLLITLPVFLLERLSWNSHLLLHLGAVKQLNLSELAGQALGGKIHSENSYSLVHSVRHSGTTSPRRRFHCHL